jgi:hypothetical protein
MATGTLTLALLALSAAAVPPDVVPINSRNFQIPIHIAEGQRSKIKELILFVSSDQGSTWNEVSVVPPDKDAFVYYAQTDGLYWFNICVVDSQGHREPPDIYRSTPRQKVLVDTLQPSVRILSAERQGEELVVAWEIQEEHPDWATLKLEHRAADGPAWTWTPVSITPALNGQTRFRVATSGSILVRMQLADQAGNTGDAQVEVGAKSGTLPSPTPTIVPAGLQNSTATALAPAASGATGTTGSSWTPPTPNPAVASPQVPNSAPAVSSRSPWDSSPPVQPVALRQNSPPGMPEHSWSSSSAPTPYQIGSSGFDSRSTAVATLTNPGYTSPLPATVAGSGGPSDAAAPVEITNSTQVGLDYVVTSVGPSGVGKVELYLTTDEGRTWKLHPETLHPEKGKPLTVNLPGEGVYGLRLVATSGFGRRRRPPQSGDLPQMRIEVDTTPPVVKLFPPQPDPNRPDALLLTWSVSERKLAANPIWLEYAESPTGPWQSIAKQLPNTGQYVWQLAPNPPAKVYLRAIAYDAAGNYGVDQLQQPFLIDLNEPEAQIKRIIKPGRRN